MEAQPFTSSVLAPKLFVEKVCSQGKKVSDDANDNHFFANMMKIKMTPQVIPHVKMLPECKNVTKQNCVTLWETDDDGKQVGQSQDDWNVDIVLSVRATHATDATHKQE